MRCTHPGRVLTCSHICHVRNPLKLLTVLKCKAAAAAFMLLCWLSGFFLFLWPQRQTKIQLQYNAVLSNVSERMHIIKKCGTDLFQFIKIVNILCILWYFVTVILWYYMWKKAEICWEKSLNDTNNVQPRVEILSAHFIHTYIKHGTDQRHCFSLGVYKICIK